jgi:hypothetical protein
LKAEDVTPDSEIANIIGMLNLHYDVYCAKLTDYTTEKETQNFKWWPRLHGYWRTLPNFNPYTVTSDPGQDLGEEALSVLMGGHEHRNLALVRAQGFFVDRIDLVCSG